MSKVRSATESVIRAEELELLEDGMIIDTDETDQNKPDFPALSALDAMVSKQNAYSSKLASVKKIIDYLLIDYLRLFLGGQNRVQKNSLPT